MSELTKLSRINTQMPDYCRIAPDVALLAETYAFMLSSTLYGCEVGDETEIGTFLEIQKGASIGDHCKISSHTFIGKENAN